MYKLKYAISDCLVMANRSIKHMIRNFELVINVLVLPIVLLLLFVLVFGGAMNVGDAKYIDYVAAGVIVLCITQCSAISAVSITTDVKQGIFERFKSMPVFRPSIIAGHFASSLIKCVFTAIVLVAVSFMIGFKTKADFNQWLLIVGIIVLYSVAITLISIFIGLIANSPDGATGYAYILNVLPYLSSAFAPTETMSDKVKVFVENQPLTHVIDALRELFLGSYNWESIKLALIWILGLMLASLFIIYIAFRRRIKS